MTYLRRNKSKTLFALALLSANLSPCNAATALLLLLHNSKVNVRALYLM